MDMDNIKIKKVILSLIYASYNINGYRINVNQIKYTNNCQNQRPLLYLSAVCLVFS